MKILSVIFLVGISMPSLVASTISNFDTAGTLSSDYNAFGLGFSEGATVGLAGGGGLNVPFDSASLSQKTLYTYKTGETITGETMLVGSSYVVSAYFRTASGNLNNGFGSLGFTSDASATGGSGFGTGLNSMGVAYYGAGITFESDVSGTVARPGSFQNFAGSASVTGGWNYFELTITYLGSNLFDMDARSWNADDNGVLGTFHGVKTQAGVSNSALAGASEIRPYFGSYGSRFGNIDNFGGTAAIPEPSSLILMLLGVVGISGYRRRQGVLGKTKNS